MTKVAALPLIIGAGLAAGGTLLDARGRRQHQRRQDAATQNWLDYQDRKTKQFNQQEEANRELAQIALNKNLEGSTQDAREDVINTEANRLEGEFTEGLPDLAGELTAGAQAPGTSQVFDEAMAAGLAETTKSVRERLAALAKATAYGGGSMGGMGVYDALRGQSAANEIVGINNNRRGDTNTLRRYQSVQPEILQYRQSPVVPLAKAAGNILLSGAGADMFGPGMTTGTGLTLADGGPTGAGFLPPPRGFSFMPPNTGGFS